MEKLLYEIEKKLLRIREELDRADKCPLGEMNKMLDGLTITTDAALRLIQNDTDFR